MISKERIEELRTFYKEAYGKELTYAEAEEMGQRLVTLYKLLRRPLPDEKKSSQEPPAQTAPK
jgi:hypothetical protein